MYCINLMPVFYPLSLASSMHFAEKSVFDAFWACMIYLTKVKYPRMKKSFLTLLALSIPAMATDAPPAIPDGPVTYDSVSYQDPMAGADYVFDEPSTPMAAAPAPITASSSSESKGYININAFSSNYQVRGMGVTDFMSSNGYSSIEGSMIVGNRNLFNKGVYQRISAEGGVIWGAASVLGDCPMFTASYALGKEIFPNFTVELGYTARYGGLEGAMARFENGAPHRFAQDLNLTLAFNDRQKGFFGSAVWGLGFQGLTGHYFDLELGYRFTDVIGTGNFGADLELSAGVSASFGYWGAGVEGVDAYRLKAALPLHTASGTMGRDAKFQVAPWVQMSTSGSNDSKIDRTAGGTGVVDHFQFTVGLDVGWRF